MKPESKAPEKSKPADEKPEIFWIYPGESRPVVVKAANKAHAEHMVQKSKDYDGFPIYVYPVDKFAGLCGGFKAEDEKEIEDPTLPNLKDPIVVVARVVMGNPAALEGFQDLEKAKRSVVNWLSDIDPLMTPTFAFFQFVPEKMTFEQMTVVMEPTPYIYKKKSPRVKGGKFEGGGKYSAFTLKPKPWDDDIKEMPSEEDDQQ